MFTVAQMGTRVRELTAFWPDVLSIDLDDDILSEANELIDRYPLRAIDAVHLSSGRALRQVTVDEMCTFACWDQRLWDAASADGFDMAPASRPGERR